MQRKTLYHISEEANITEFKPRPSPSYFESVKGDVVFAISETLLHNYLFPREFPRVTFYAGENTTDTDKETFFEHTSARFVVAVEWKWLPIIQQTELYCYELPAETFLLLDECAGYSISYQTVKPLSVYKIDNLLEELSKQNIELRIVPNLWTLANEVVASSLSYSVIRMRNAEKITM